MVTETNSLGESAVVVTEIPLNLADSGDTLLVDEVETPAADVTEDLTETVDPLSRLSLKLNLKPLLKKQ
jgi:hypothetical protein